MAEKYGPPSQEISYEYFRERGIDPEKYEIKDTSEKPKTGTSYLASIYGELAEKQKQAEKNRKAFLTQNVSDGRKKYNPSVNYNSDSYQPEVSEEQAFEMEAQRPYKFDRGNTIPQNVFFPGDGGIMAPQVQSLKTKTPDPNYPFVEPGSLIAPTRVTSQAPIPQATAPRQSTITSSNWSSPTPSPRAQVDAGIRIDPAFMRGSTVTPITPGIQFTQLPSSPAPSPAPAPMNTVAFNMPTMKGLGNFGGMMRKQTDWMEIIDDTSGYDVVEDSTADVDPNTGCRYTPRRPARKPFSYTNNICKGRGEIDPVTGERTMIASFVPEKNGEAVLKVADVEYFPDATVARDVEVSYPETIKHINDYYGRMITDISMGEAGGTDQALRETILESQGFVQDASKELAPSTNKLLDKFNKLDINTKILLLGAGYFAVKMLPSKYLYVAAGLLAYNQMKKSEA